MRSLRSMAKGRLEELCKYRDDEIRQAKANLEESMAQRDQAHAKYLARRRDLKERNAAAPEDFESAEFGFKSLASATQHLQLSLR